MQCSFSYLQTKLIRHHNDGKNCLTLQEGTDQLTIDECDGSEVQQWLMEPPSTLKNQF